MSQKPASSKYHGVSFHNNKWRARISKNNREYNLGSFDIEEDAARRYDKEAQKIHGNKAKLNFPEVSG